MSGIYVCLYILGISFYFLPLQIRWLGYPSATAYIVIVIVALAEELLASI
jgi:hypothetical protein